MSYEMPNNPRQLLPREAYISSDWFEREQKFLFSNSWMFVGVITDLPNAGDYITIRAGYYPLIILRDKNEKLKAFHNICRHRGTELLEGKGSTGKLIVCPYHRWTFDLEGQLRGIPDQKLCFPDIDKASLNLIPASLGVFKGMIFVHPQERPTESFKDWLGNLNETSWPHDITKLYEGETYTYDMRCNWKVFYENAIDGYHLGYLHEKTLGATLSPLTQYWETHGRHLSWFSTERNGVKNTLPVLSESQAKAAWLKPGKGLEATDYPGVVMMFPLLSISPSPYDISISQIIPISSDVTYLKVRNWLPQKTRRHQVKYIYGYDPKTQMITSSRLKKHPLNSEDFQTEDVWICEKIQRSLKSPFYSVGALAQGAGGEAPLLHFQQQIVDFLPNK